MEQISMYVVPEKSSAAKIALKQLDFVWNFLATFEPLLALQEQLTGF